MAEISEFFNALRVNEESNLIKPIIKWVGGKTQIIDKIIDKFPDEIDNYREIFLGGGSVLLALLSQEKNKKIKINGGVYAYDINEPLINMYKNIQNNHNKLYEELQILIAEFNSCGNGVLNRKPTIIDAKLNKENYYYWIRGLYNTDNTGISGSAKFIFLNKTCFRGVFRMGPNGFNVPYGHYDNPEIINKEHLDELHALIQNVVFRCCGFEISMAECQSGDFMYLDPPYAPVNTNSFVGYTKDGFTLERHKNLFNLIKLCPGKIMMSNADVKLVRDYFEDKKYNIISLSCKRSINSKKPGARANEVIISCFII